MSITLTENFPEVWTYIVIVVTSLEGVLTTKSHPSKSESSAAHQPSHTQEVK